MPHRHEHERRVASLLLLDRLDHRRAFDALADAQRMVKRHTAPRPQPPRQRHRRQKPAAARVAVGPQLRLARHSRRKRPMKPQRRRIALLRRLAGMIQRRVPSRDAARRDPISRRLRPPDPRLPVMARLYEFDSHHRSSLRSRDSRCGPGDQQDQTHPGARPAVPYSTSLSSQSYRPASHKDLPWRTNPSTKSGQPFEPSARTFRARIGKSSTPSSAYPDEFVSALTTAGWMAALIPAGIRRRRPRTRRSVGHPRRDQPQRRQLRRVPRTALQHGHAAAARIGRTEARLPAAHRARRAASSVDRRHRADDGHGHDARRRRSPQDTATATS